MCSKICNLIYEKLKCIECLLVFKIKQFDAFFPNKSSNTNKKTDKLNKSDKSNKKISELKEVVVHRLPKINITESNFNEIEKKETLNTEEWDMI